MKSQTVIAQYKWLGCDDVSVGAVGVAQTTELPPYGVTKVACVNSRMVC